MFMIFALLYCLIVKKPGMFVLSAALRDTPMARYSLFVLKVQLLNNQLFGEQ